MALVLSRSPTDLLSSANMRTRLEAASPIARALYLHAFTLPIVMRAAHLELIERKLDSIAEQEASDRRLGLATVQGDVQASLKSLTT